MELTQEHFDQVVNALATKADLAAQTKELKAYADDQTEKLARIISNSFDEEREYLKETLDVTKRVKTLETDIQKIKEALHIR